MTVQRYQIAAIQMTSGKQPDDNLRQAGALLVEARQKGAELAVLPENFAGYGGDYRVLGERHDELVGWLCEQASSLDMAIIGGSLPALQRPDGQPVPSPLVRTCSIAVNAAGECLARYDKLHLFDADVQDAQGRYRESDFFEPGQEVVTTTLGDLQVGMAICYDLRFPALAQRLVAAGAHLLVYPSAFTAYGHSMLVDPWGRVVDSLSDSPGALVAELDLATMNELRQSMPVQQHQRFRIEGPYDT